MGEGVQGQLDFGEQRHTGRFASKSFHIISRSYYIIDSGWIWLNQLAQFVSAELDWDIHYHCKYL